MNYYLGVGWNVFIIFLLHRSTRPPTVIATYKINIYRQTRNEDRKHFDSRSPHEVCTVKQVGTGFGKPVMKVCVQAVR